MITKCHKKDNVKSIAIYSDCEKYRYSLTRIWDDRGKRVNFVMMNPSDDDSVENDGRTVKRCRCFARKNGYGGFAVTNLFAWIDKKPDKMLVATEPVGFNNDDFIRNRAEWASDIIVAWGNDMSRKNRGAAVACLLDSIGKPLFCFGSNQTGHPTHPRSVPNKQGLERWVNNLVNLEL